MLKLRKAKEALMSEERKEVQAEKRDRELAKRLFELTGSEDGNSEKVKQRLSAEIAARKELAAARRRDRETEMAVEEEYGKQLVDEMRLIDRSLVEFEQYRKTVLDGLKDELINCGNSGYLDMLKRELRALQLHPTPYTP
jgi:hypothetical protein